MPLDLAVQVHARTPETLRQERRHGALTRSERPIRTTRVGWAPLGDQKNGVLP